MHLDIPMHELISMIREIQPEKSYPVHTEHVELFDALKDDGIDVIHPKLS
jgi:ribonuclease J